MRVCPEWIRDHPILSALGLHAVVLAAKKPTDKAREHVYLRKQAWIGIW